VEMVIKHEARNGAHAHHVHVHTHMHTHMAMYMHMHTHTHMHMHTHTHMHMHTHTAMYMHTCMRMHMHMRTWHVRMRASCGKHASAQTARRCYKLQALQVTSYKLQARLSADGEALLATTAPFGAAGEAGASSSGRMLFL